MSGTEDDRIIQCGTHGTVSRAFVCGHIFDGSGAPVGFNEPELDPDGHEPHAWCDECDALVVREGVWNDDALKFADIRAVCEFCFAALRSRHEHYPDDKAPPPEGVVAAVRPTHALPAELDEEGPPLVPRTADEVARRALALMAIVSRAHEEVADDSLGWVEENGIAAFFSSAEHDFYFLSVKPSRTDSINFSWKVEALVSILWALKIVDVFPPLNAQTDIWSYDKVMDIVDSTTVFLANAELRPMDHIEQLEADLCHQHWRVRDARLFGKKMPSELDPGIVYERRYGLSWIVGWGDDWDNVPTDT